MGTGWLDATVVVIEAGDGAGDADTVTSIGVMPTASEEAEISP